MEPKEFQKKLKRHQNRLDKARSFFGKGLNIDRIAKIVNLLGDEAESLKQEWDRQLEEKQ